MACPCHTFWAMILWEGCLWLPSYKLPLVERRGLAAHVYLRVAFSIPVWPILTAPVTTHLDGLVGALQGLLRFCLEPPMLVSQGQAVQSSLSAEGSKTLGVEWLPGQVGGPPDLQVSLHTRQVVQPLLLVCVGPSPHHHPRPYFVYTHHNFAFGINLY